jgi:hypothetical protein
MVSAACAGATADADASAKIATAIASAAALRCCQAFVLVVMASLPSLIPQRALTTRSPA